MKKLIRLFRNREVMAYLIAGVLTTLVNIAVYHVTKRLLLMDVLLANAIAWILSVLFAFVVNDRFVFIQDKLGMKDELFKMAKFFAARLFSFFVDEAGMWFLVAYLKAGDMLPKIIMNIVVIILNYVFSKLFIFRSRERETETHGD